MGKGIDLRNDDSVVGAAVAEAQDSAVKEVITANEVPPSEADWGKTALGLAENWHPVLRTAVRLCLDSSVPMSLTWGPEMLHVYNDAYLPIIQHKHPSSMGRPLRENWPEVWETIAPLFDGVRETGEAVSVKCLPLVLHRRGFKEEAFLAFDLSPIREGDGPALGTFNPCQEITPAVLLQRRQKTLQDVAATSIQNGMEELTGDLMKVLSANGLDVPFAALYLIKTKRAFSFAAGCGVSAGEPWWDDEVDRDRSHPWALAEAAEANTQLIAHDLELLSPPIVHGPWNEPIRTAVLTKVQWSGNRPNGVLIVGTSPRLVVDDDYLRFIDQLTEQVASRLGAAQALAAQVRRAATLEVAVRTNREIGAAIGILMSRYRINEEQAFALLTRSSQTENVKLRQVAERVVQSISKPGARDVGISPTESPAGTPAVSSFERPK